MSCPSEVEVPPSFPDPVRFQMQGFIEHAATHAAGQRIEVSSTRESPVRMTFRGRRRT